MRWIRFTAQGPYVHGSLDGTTVREVSGAPWVAHEPTGKTYALNDVKLEVPVIPPTFYAAGINYAAHIREMAEKRGVKPVFPEKADIGYRANNALIAHDEDVVIPKDATEQGQYEGELVVVIGKRRSTCRRPTRCPASSATRSATTSASAPGSAATALLARQEHRYLQADGPVDRHRRGSRRNARPACGSMAAMYLRFKTNDMIFGIPPHRGDDPATSRCIRAM